MPETNDDLWQLSDPQDPIARFRQELVRLVLELALEEIPPEDLKTLGLYIFPGAPDLVWRVTEAIHGHQRLFHDQRPGWQELARRQQRATSLHQAERQLQRQLGRVRRNRILEQGQAVRAVVKLLDRIERSDRDYFESLELADWEDPAVLAEVRRRQMRQIVLGRVGQIMKKWRARFKPGKAKP